MDYFSFRLACRKVCSSLRTAVVKFGMHFDKVMVAIIETMVFLSLGEEVILYSEENNDAVVVGRKKKSTFEGKTYLEIAIKDLETVMNHVSTLFLTIDADAQQGFITTFRKTLKESKCVNVRMLYLVGFSFDGILSILPIFICQVLNNITLFKTTAVNRFERIEELDQWKNAKECIILSTSPLSNQIEQLFHLREFQICISHLPIQHAIKIKDAS